MKLCPPLNFFLSSSSSDHSDHSSLDKGSLYQKKQLLHSSSPPPCYTLFESHLGSSPSSLSAVESTSRGPNGHFIAPPYLKDTKAMHIQTKKEFPQSTRQDNSEGSKSSFFQDSPKPCSVRSEERMIQDPPSTGQDSHSKCLTLMKEQEELKSFTTSHRSQKCEMEQRQTKSACPIRKWEEVHLDEPISKPRDIPFRQKAQRPCSLARQVSEYRRGCYFGNTSSPMEKLLTSTSPYIQWDISPVTSPSSQIPVLSLLETPHCMLPDTPHRGLEAIEDLAAEGSSHSPVTQCTSLSVFSHHRDSPSYCETDIIKAQAQCPERPIDGELSSRNILTEDHWIQEKEVKTQASVSTSTCPVPCSFQHQGAFNRTQHSAFERGKEAISEGHFPKFSINVSHSFTGCSNNTYDDQKSASEIKTGDKHSSSSLQPEEEKEGIRACSHKSEKCVFSVSPNYISSLPLLENEFESDQSNFSIRLSESLKSKIVSQPDRMSPLQPSTILEYLSLPGFVEMSVDEPSEDCQLAESPGLSTTEANRTVLRGEPDVVPKKWENQEHYHLEECDDNQSRFLVDLKIPIVSVGGSISENVTSSKPCLELTQGISSIHSGSSETKCISTQYSAYEGRRSQPLFSHKSIGSDKPTHLCPSQPIVRNKVVYNIPYQGESMEVSSSDDTQWCQTQNKGTNQVSIRIPQAPVPFMKKSVSIGPCRDFSGMGQHHPFFKKSISLGSQTWEHYQCSRTNNSRTNKNYYKDELPYLNIKDKFYNSSCTPANSYLRSAPSWQGAGHAKSYGRYGLERPCHSDQSYQTMTPSSLMHTHGSSVLDTPKLVEPDRRESDPRRQATVFPETLSCPLSYQETLRLVQHRYIPQGPSRPLIAPRQVSRWDHPHPMDSRKSFQRPFLPRGYSWPSTHQAAFPSGEIQRELYGVGMGEGRDSTGRASYASQSSGRGSVGLFGHQSLSITPTLLSSPETTEEREKAKRESNLREHRSKR